MGKSIGLLILRLGIGVNLVYLHGWDKVQKLFEDGPKIFPDPLDLAKLLPGVSDGPAWSLGLAAFAEFLCAIAVGIGLLTRLTAIPVVATMGVALYWHHYDQQDSWATMQMAMLYLVPYLALVFTGPGQISVDHMLWKRKHTAEKL